ncbi:predicted protein [Sclerotinia sclerotiorum 1980 UF-70]|uniref:Uncharacterized protein n=1 Tax=Sclerotinia sclerotiorum (strain ATCC 18683 / 1980 / Ss-1) TaxID=665079 RepID=A7EWP2_SCLS1|nr:predicted protein [Sclerotinia sclerotiorum 1980 UF-70]EDN93884.1 predicted protein [Sclerotinia sclerotiorum 1980 UF-70]
MTSASFVFTKILAFKNKVLHCIFQGVSNTKILALKEFAMISQEFVMGSFTSPLDIKPGAAPHKANQYTLSFPPQNRIHLSNAVIIILST